MTGLLVTAAVSTGVSVGVGGRGMGASGTPLAWLGSLGEGEAGMDGLLLGGDIGETVDAGVSEVPVGHRPQVAAQ